MDQSPNTSIAGAVTAAHPVSRVWFKGLGFRFLGLGFRFRF